MAFCFWNEIKISYYVLPRLDSWSCLHPPFQSFLVSLSALLPIPTFIGLQIGSETHKALLSLLACALVVLNAWNTPSLVPMMAGTFSSLRRLFKSCLFREVLMAIPSKARPFSITLTILYYRMHCTSFIETGVTLSQFINTLCICLLFSCLS